MNLLGGVETTKCGQRGRLHIRQNRTNWWRNNICQPTRFTEATAKLKHRLMICNGTENFKNDFKQTFFSHGVEISYRTGEIKGKKMHMTDELCEELALAF